MKKENIDFSIDDIKLDTENKEFQDALDIVQYTNNIIYLTGKAGTGKTTFLKYLRKVTDKSMVVLAPTGVAALNAKGQTIHSFFSLPPSLFVPDDKRFHEDFYTTFKYNSGKINIIKKMELLVIDEISMVRCDIMDAIDVILRKIRGNNTAFGGVQVLLIGDTFQLPPVAKTEEWQILEKFYKNRFFFSSRVISNNKLTYIELKKIYRQNEQEFIDILNRVRVGKTDPSDLNILNQRVESDFVSTKDNYITLTTTNQTAGFINNDKLEELNADSYYFKAEIKDNFIKDYPTDAILELKQGAQVMFIKNGIGYYNGKIGKIYDVNEDEIIVEIDNKYGEKHHVHVKKYTWENISYTWNEKEKTIEEKVIGTFTQYPLRLAWAITVHKSQGMTFEKVVADIKNSFEAGQVYVALSRCTSLNGLIMKTPINIRSIITDNSVIKFAQNETPDTLILEELRKGKANFFYSASHNFFKQGKAEDCYDNFLKAIKFRNDIETEMFKRVVIHYIDKYHYRCSQNIRNQKYITEQKYYIDNLNDTITDYKKENTFLKEKIRELEKNNSRLQIQNDNNIKKISKQEEIIDEINNKINENKKIINDLNKDIADLVLDNATLNEINIKWEKDYYELQNKCNYYLSIANQKDRIIDKEEAEINMLKKEVIKNESYIKSLTEEADVSKKINKKLEDDKFILEQELVRVKNIKWYQKLFNKK